MLSSEDARKDDGGALVLSLDVTTHPDVSEQQVKLSTGHPLLLQTHSWGGMFGVVTHSWGGMFGVVTHSWGGMLKVI